MKIFNILIFVSVIFLLSCSKQNSNTNTTPVTLYKFGFKVDGVQYAAEFEKGTLYNGNECSYKFVSNFQSWLNFHSTKNSISLNSQLYGLVNGSLTINYYTSLSGLAHISLGLVDNSSNPEIFNVAVGDSMLINMQSLSPNSIQNSDSTKAGKAIGTFKGCLTSSLTGTKKIITDGYFEAIRVQ